MDKNKDKEILSIKSLVSDRSLYRTFKERKIRYLEKNRKKAGSGNYIFIWDREEISKILWCNHGDSMS